MNRASDNLTRPSPRAKLWLAFWGGGVAWLIHLLAAYALGEFGCISGLGHHRFLGISSVAWLLLVISATCAGASVSSLILASRIRSGLQSSLYNAERPQSPEESLASTALIANMVFLFVIGIQTIPIFFFLRDC